MQALAAKLEQSDYLESVEYYPKIKTDVDIVDTCTNIS